ncbi:cytochrome P450 [Leucogyrophana mollusca]|uniref:Cytochrome P450 n=1 Tax=Leucogyrophana mollusca TaxID=85980 RepID=A0ACB8B8R6_9AGAM|nr:cytochrome P450 [Leucogyrophana mollusca]
MTWLSGLLAIASVFLLAVWRKSAFSRNTRLLPPGPPAHWFWGNAMPRVNIAHTLAEWVNTYGPILTLRQGSQVIIIIGRHQAATEIMEKEGGALADRPRFVAAGEMLSHGMRIHLSPYGEKWKRLRRAVHTHFQPKAAETYQPLQMFNAKNLIMDLLENPKEHQRHARRLAASVILRVTYGKTTPTATTDPEVKQIHKVLQNFQMAFRPGAYLVDRIPILKYLPGYANHLKRWREEEVRLFTHQLNRVRTDMRGGQAGPSFTRYLLDSVNDHSLCDEEMAYLSGALFGAGAETTAVSITNMIMAAACYPEAQKKVQAELDKVVGRDRPPTFADQESLPQLQAFIEETLRWRPILPIGFPHRAARDIIWGGYCIPEGATVFGSHWAISRDPDTFPNPETFDPERWLDNGKLRPDMSFFTFGFGRRVCPGQHIANRSLYINLALIFWSFRISQVPSAPIDVTAFSDSVIASPKPFEVNFEKRIGEQALRTMLEDYGSDI